MNWIVLNSPEQVNEIEKSQGNQQMLIYKHSDRCGVCHTVLEQLERDWDEKKGITPFFLDVVKDRSLSKEVARRFNIPHESPQAIIVQQGKPVYHASHFDIRFADFSGKKEQDLDS